MNKIFTFYYSYSGKKIDCQVFNPAIIIRVEKALRVVLEKHLSSPSKSSIDLILKKSNFFTN